MTAAPSRQQSRGLQLISKSISTHWKFWAAVIAGGAIYLTLPTDWSIITRVLTAWDVAVTLLLLLIFATLTRKSSKQLQEQYKQDDPTAPVILAVVVVAALLSIAAIIVFLSTVKQAPASQKAAHILLATLTIMVSWLIVPTIYAVHYADLFYSAPTDRRPLVFPATPQPAFWDFAYFSFTIAAACQTADVATCDVKVRKNVIAHSVISVLFNVSILGFAVNITAGLLA